MSLRNALILAGGTAALLVLPATAAFAGGGYGCNQYDCPPPSEVTVTVTVPVTETETATVTEEVPTTVYSTETETETTTAVETAVTTETATETTTVTETSPVTTTETVYTTVTDQATATVTESAVVTVTDISTGYETVTEQPETVTAIQDRTIILSPSVETVNGAPVTNYATETIEAAPVYYTDDTTSAATPTDLAYTGASPYTGILLVLGLGLLLAGAVLAFTTRTGKASTKPSHL